MSRLIAQIMLAILLLPLTTVVYIVVLATCFANLSYSPARGETAFVSAGLVAWGFMAAYWTTLWRKTVSWTPGRMGGTLFCYVAAAIGGIVLGAFVGGMTEEEEVGFLTASAVAPLLWHVGTILVWRETDAERAARLSRQGLNQLPCPTCGYNLVGLKGTRCPECGSEFTLDAILAGQPANRQAEVEA